MKLIYIAGRYRGKTREAVDLNIQAARAAGVLVVEKGYYPVIPHSNTSGFEHLTATHDAFWLAGTLELMRRCDAVLVVQGYEQSSGTLAEIQEAQRLGVPVYKDILLVPEQAGE